MLLKANPTNTVRMGFEPESNAFKSGAVTTELSHATVLLRQLDLNIASVRFKPCSHLLFNLFEAFSYEYLNLL